jgi:hypothetical protein
MLNFVLSNLLKMKKFKIVPLSKAFAQKIRSTMKDDFGHDVTGKIATGAGLAGYR